VFYEGPSKIFLVDHNAFKVGLFLTRQIKHEYVLWNTVSVPLLHKLLLGSMLMWAGSSSQSGAFCLAGIPEGLSLKPFGIVKTGFSISRMLSRLSVA